MSSTLLQSATAVLTPDFVSRASAQLGEPEDGVLKALSRGAVPTVLVGLSAQAERRGGAEQIFGLLADPAFDSRDAHSPGTLFGDAGARIRYFGGRLLALLFDGRLDALTTALAGFAGIHASSASSLLRVAAPLVLGVVADRVKRDDLDAVGLSRLLAAERDTSGAVRRPAARSDRHPREPRGAARGGRLALARVGSSRSCCSDDVARSRRSRPPRPPRRRRMPDGGPLDRLVTRRLPSGAEIGFQ
jgi:hypothetical protein